MRDIVMKYRGYLIDLDGTIYLGNEPIPSGKKFVEDLQERNIPFFFVTNNTTKKPEVVSHRLAEKFGIYVDSEKIYTASQATIDYMIQQDKGKKVYIIGESGLKDLVIEAGFVWEEEQPDYVIVGLDNHLTYEKLAIATLAIQKGAVFIGTNPDKNIPTERGLMPGAGAIVSLIETATNTKPIFIGKPEAMIMNSAVQLLELDKSEVLMVGDNYETDIQAGIKNGIDTLLVLSGFTPEAAVPHLPEMPTYVAKSLSEWSFDL